MLILILDSTALLKLDSVSFNTPHRLLVPAETHSVLINNTPFHPYICSVLPLTQQEIDAGRVEIHMTRDDGRTEQRDAWIGTMARPPQSYTAFSVQALRLTADHLLARGLPLSLALSHVHAMAAAAPLDGKALSNGAGIDDPIAATIAPHFDTILYRTAYPDLGGAAGALSDTALLLHYCKTGWREGRNPSSTFDSLFYLTSNPDVAAAGINPLWHYVVAGRAEGRRAQPEDRHGQAIRRMLPALQRRDDGEPPLAITRLSRTRLAEAVAVDIRASTGGSELHASIRSVRGVVLAISHSLDARAIGGRVILIPYERKRFNALGYTYIHIQPGVPSLSIDREGVAGRLIEVSVNGIQAGLTDYDELAQVLSETFSDRAIDRVFTIHGFLGHRIDGLIALQQAVRAGRNWLWVHDFSSICANHLLLRNDVSFCGAPPPDSPACRICLHGETRSAHSRRLGRLFAAIDLQVVAPSQSALDLWRKSTPLPTLPTRVVPLSRWVEQGARHLLDDEATLGLPGVPVRVAFVGTPTFHEGWEIFEELVQALRVCPSYRLHHIATPACFRRLSGVTEVPVVEMQDGLPNISDALKTHGIDLVLVLTVSPETFSFSTREALAAGADVVALDDSGDAAATVSQLGRGRTFATDRALLEFFTSFDAVHYVRSRLREGIMTGRFVYDAAMAIPIPDEMGG